MTWYAGDSNNVAREVKGVYVGNANDVAQKITRAYVGDSNGIARQLFPETYLPVGYTQVEYIEGTGTQFIRTYVRLSTNQIAGEITFALSTNTYSNNDPYLLGCFGGSSARFYVAVIHSTKKVRLALGKGWYEHTSVADTSKHTYMIDMANLKTYYDGVSKAKNSSNAYSRGTNSQSIIGIFKGTDETGQDLPKCAEGKFYNAKIWISGILEHDYYPCIRNSDGEPGLYDIVTDTFLTNAGSGTFGVGPKHEEQL